ncbi:selenium metabolism-associated LysR family transcriptional regulator [Alteribacillus sp. HJP-4]|uniref:selenium metabolism-associated LysR family transcriptional regulator n=1 Tax=Alteribacillus sp. HJP-4 TaxID=2775394 RepID=UPI0035CD23B6
MNEKQLQLFQELARQRSFSKTADKMHISQSTVTKNLQNLEKELGTLLMDRKTLSLTEEGKLALEKIQTLLASWEELRSLSSKLGNKYERTLRVGASTTPGTYFLPSICKKCHEELPQLRLHLHIDNSETIIQLLKDQEIDIAIVGHDVKGDDFQTSPLISEKLAIIAPPETEEDQWNCFEELKIHPFIKRKEGSGTYHAAKAGLTNWGGSLSLLETAAIVPNTESVISLVEAGIGCGFISEHALKGAVTRGCHFKGFLPGERTFFISVASQDDPIMETLLELMMRWSRTRTLL